MRKALCIGINYYMYTNCLKGAVSDAEKMAKALKKQNHDETENFEVTLKTAKYPTERISRSEMKKAINELFSGEPDVALFYYAGHGTHNDYSGYLCPSDSRPGEPEDGLSLEYLMNVVKKSEAKNKIIILDSCSSGFAGDYANLGGSAALPENTTIMAACEKDGYAQEPDDNGIFTSLILEALDGGAMDILGNVTTSSVYDYVVKSLHPDIQKPILKANIQNPVILRVNKPPLTADELVYLVTLFKNPFMELPLNPRYEEDKHHAEDKTHDPKLEAIFKILRKFHQYNLVVPHESEEYMYWAAIHSKSCHLTARGRQYWHKVATLNL